MKCTCCNKSIALGNGKILNGKIYGTTCYKRELALIYKQFEDIKNEEYSKKCFSAIQVLKTKKQNSFTSSVISQYEKCQKLTMNQFKLIQNMFSPVEEIDYLSTLFVLGNKETKKYCSNWIIYTIGKNKLQKEYIDNEEINNIILHDICMKNGFHYYYDVDEPEKIFFMENGKENINLNNNESDEYYIVLKVVR